MKSRTTVKKKMAGSCLALCLTGALAWNMTGVTAWAAPSSGTAMNDNTIVREKIKGNPAGSLSANQEVTIKSEKKSDDGYTWYEVTFDWNGQKTDGWVRSDLISTGGAADSSTEENTDANANHDDEAVPISTNDESQPVADGFQINGVTYKIADSFPADQIPKGFAATTITYEGANAPAAQMENGAQVFLVYLQSTENPQQKGVFVYDAERKEAIPFVSIAQQDSFVVVTNVPTAEAEKVSDRYQATQCTFENGSIMAYQASDTDETVSADVSASEFYYVYGTSSSGQSGWYVYDSVNKTLQRSMANMQYGSTAQNSAGDQKTASGFDKNSMTRMLTAGIGIVALLLLILLIVMSVRYHRLRRYLDGAVGPDDEEDDETPTKTFEVELKGSKVDVLDLDSEIEKIGAKKPEHKKTEVKDTRETAPESKETVQKEQPKKEKKQEKESADKPLFAKKTQTEKPLKKDVMVEIPEVEEPVETVKEIEEEVEAEIDLDTPKTKESNPDTEQLVADLKKLIQEVENSANEEKEPEEAFLDGDEEEEPEISDEKESSEKKETEKPKKKKSKKAKKDSWDDIEFL